MSMANRDQAIIDFQEKSGVNILIVSLKAAALGLNLVAANHVVLLDLVSSLFIWSVCSDLDMIGACQSPHLQGCLPNSSQQTLFIAVTAVTTL